MTHDQRVRAFRWLVTRLQIDPRLRVQVKTWLVWDGTPSSNVELPALAGSFAVRLTPTFEPQTPEATDGQGGVIYRCPVLVVIEARTAGQDADKLTDFWGAVEGALDRERDIATAHEAGISWWEWVQPGAAAGDNLISTGTLRLVCYTRK